MLTESDNWRQICEFSVADALRDSEASDGETGDEVGPKKLEVVIGAPLENREEELEEQNQLLNPGLVLEPVERIVGEEDLSDSLLQFLDGGSVRRHANFVRHFQRWGRRHCVVGAVGDG